MATRTKRPRAAHPLQFPVALVGGKFDKQPMQQTEDLAVVLARFNGTPDVRGSKDGPGITLGEFDEAAWRADPRPIGRNGHNGAEHKRTGWLADEYCAQSSGYLGDLDNKIGQGDETPRVENPVTFKQVREILDRLGCAYALHTTYTSTSEWPRLRFVIPFAQPLTGEDLKARYLAVHNHLNALFAGALDSRSAPSFFAYLPAVPAEHRAEYCSLVVADRSLFDPYAIDIDTPASAAGKSKDATSADEEYAFAKVGSLPSVKLSHFSVKGALLSTIKDGAPPGKDRSKVLAGVYQKLRGLGMTPAQIAAVIWNSEHKIGDAAREAKRGYAWLCEDIKRVLAKYAEERTDRAAALVARFIYIERQCMYWDRLERVPLTEKNFNDRHIVEFGSGDGPVKWNAHKQWQTTWKNHDGQRVYDVTYWPGAPEIVVFNGRLCLNQWIPADLETSDGDVSLWLGAFERLIPDRAQREHLMDWMGFVVQNPGKKVHHHPIVGSADQGAGKDSVFVPFIYAVGGGGIPGQPGHPVYNGRNVQYVSNRTVGDKWKYHLLSQLIVVQEIREVLKKDQSELANDLKQYMAAPPPIVMVDEKFTKPYPIPNTMVWTFFTNSTTPIALEDKDRRFHALWSYAGPMPAEQRNALWSFYRNGGLAAVAGWLKRRDVSRFDPYAPAPDTPWKQAIAEASKTEAQSQLGNLITRGAEPFDQELVAPDEAARDLNVKFEESRHQTGRHCELTRRVSGGQVSAELIARGWRALGRIDNKRKGKTRFQKTLFMRPDTKTDYTMLLNTRGGHAQIIDAYRAMHSRGKGR